jgi:PqqD family protein of HPr-rel-A system
LTATLWRAAAKSDCALAQWDDHVVVFHRPSGLTHFINASMAQLLTDVSAGPCHTELLVDRFIDDPDSFGPPEVRDHVLSLLFRLEELGLIERVVAVDAG